MRRAKRLCAARNNSGITEENKLYVYAKRCRYERNFCERRNKSRDKVYVAGIAVSSAVKQNVKKKKRLENRRVLIFDVFIGDERREKDDLYPMRPLLVEACRIP